MDEYIKREDALKALQTVRDVIEEINNKRNTYTEAEKQVRVEIINACERVINRIPAADVAPKSEVERIFDELWEEIRKIASDYPRGALLALLKVAELEKKYTEENV